MPIPFSLAYGNQSIPFQSPRDCTVEWLIPAPAGPVDEIRRSAALALQQPIGSRALREIAKGKRSAVILVSGRDRVTRADLFMPAIFAALNAADVPPEGIIVVAATGTHVPFSDGDLLRVTGGPLPPGVRMVGHDCRDERRLVDLGETSLGNRVRVNRLAHEAELKILTGRITHHYFAGFTGGRKAVLPGISALETIEYNHRFVVSAAEEPLVGPRVGNGCLTGNPVHADMLEAARLFAPDFLVNTVLSADHELAGIFAGDPWGAHLAGCKLVDAMCGLRNVKPATLVAASCGGAPYDCSFMQAIKTIFNCHTAVTDGGTLLVLAECPEGMKSGFLKWGAIANGAAMIKRLRTDYDLTGHNSYLLRQVLSRIRVVLVSALARDDVAAVGLIPGDDAVAELARLDRRLRDDRRALFIPHGNITVVNPLPRDECLVDAELCQGVS